MHNQHNLYLDMMSQYIDTYDFINICMPEYCIDMHCYLPQNGMELKSHEVLSRTQYSIYRNMLYIYCGSYCETYL